MHVADDCHYFQIRLLTRMVVLITCLWHGSHIEQSVRRMLFHPLCVDRHCSGRLCVSSATLSSKTSVIDHRVSSTTFTDDVVKWYKFSTIIMCSASKNCCTKYYYFLQCSWIFLHSFGIYFQVVSCDIHCLNGP